MTTSSCPTFRDWQMDHALRTADPDRFLRLVARWRIIRAYLLRRAVAIIAAGMVAGFRRAASVLAEAFRKLADAIRPALTAFANLARGLNLDTLE